MGANMARRLKETGYEIGGIYDIRSEVAEALAAEIGGVACKELPEVTRLSDVVITVVTDDGAMRTIFSGTGHSLLKDAAGRVFINCATVTPSLHIEMENLARHAGASTLEACMASSISQARSGTLYLMMAGERAVFESQRPLLEKLSTSLRYIGPTGRAAEVKALVNMVMNINTAGLAEGLALGDALGLDLAMLREVFSQTGANSRVLETDGEDMQNRDHDCYFSAAHAAKDAGIALELALEYGVATPLAAATKAQYDLMLEAGLGGLDKSGIAELTFKDRRPGNLE